jgi:ABC-type lipoprotein export system ATPase subunit
MNKLIEVKTISKVYDRGLIEALNEVSLSLEKGKIYALMGASGCGKSTLLNIIGTLDNASKGEVMYEGKYLKDLENLYEFRQNFIGFIFQFHHLIPVLTLRENIEAALLFNKNISSSQRYAYITNLLDDMNILHRESSYATEISGGERQRGAIARALVNTPKIILADEPTGNVDSKTAKIILKKLQEYVQKNSGCMLIATHDQNVANIADVVITMEDGKIIEINEQNIQDKKFNE